jgi:hypothetical protein
LKQNSRIRSRRVREFRIFRPARFCQTGRVRGVPTPVPRPALPGDRTADAATAIAATHVPGADSDLTGLPWVNHRVRKWEPEPLRWLGVHAMYAMYRRADRQEYRSASPALARRTRARSSRSSSR